MLGFFNGFRQLASAWVGCEEFELTDWQALSTLDDKLIIEVFILGLISQNALREVSLRSRLLKGTWSDYLTYT